MTSSVTPTEEPEGSRRAMDPDRRLRLAVIAAALVAGWGFILWAHKFRFEPPVVFLWLGWLAVVSGVHYLWRTGTATADPSDEDAAWWRPTGARDELEREKRSLLKAIKEVEFDLQTGKMTDKDAQEITRMYRARAIEVIKAIDELDASGGKRSARQQIERELKARLAIEGQAKAAVEKEKKRGKGKQPAAKQQAKAVKPEPEKKEPPADKPEPEKKEPPDEDKDPVKEPEKQEPVTEPEKREPVMEPEKQAPEREPDAAADAREEAS